MDIDGEQKHMSLSPWSFPPVGRRDVNTEAHELVYRHTSEQFYGGEEGLTGENKYLTLKLEVESEVGKRWRVR